METGGAGYIALDLRVDASNPPIIVNAPSLIRIDEGTMTTIHERLKVGEVFQDFKSFKAVLDAYTSDIHIPFHSRNATTVEYSNSKSKKTSSQYPVEWRFSRIQFRCKHFGEHKARGTGHRSTRSVNLVNPVHLFQSH